MKFRYQDDNGKFEKCKIKEKFQDQYDEDKNQALDELTAEAEKLALYEWKNVNRQ